MLPVDLDRFWADEGVFAELNEGERFLFSGLL